MVLRFNLCCVYLTFWFKVVMSYCTLSIALLELSRLLIKEIHLYITTTTTTKMFTAEIQRCTTTTTTTKTTTTATPRSKTGICVLRHGRRCVQNCCIFVDLQRRAGAVGQADFGSTPQGVEGSQKFLESQVSTLVLRGMRGLGICLVQYV